MPLPARQLTARYRGAYFTEWMKPLASIRTSKGCPHRCNFCALWKDFVAFGRHCRSQQLSFCTFSVLTPLPGTDFYRQVKDQMITHDLDLFDFLHTQLPTRLPLPEFYHQLYKLYRGAMTMGAKLRMVRKFRLREIPAMMLRSERIFARIRAAHRDHLIVE